MNKLRRRLSYLKSFYRHYKIFNKDRGRFFIAYEYYQATISEVFRWLQESKEVTNFTFDLNPVNKKYLISLISVLTKTDFNLIEGYIQELESDETLRKHVSRISEIDPQADKQAKYGRRLGWYAFVRAMKPKLVVETGVDKGLGSCVLAFALMKNAEEGFLGKYIGTDNNPKAGYLFTPPYSDFGEILYDDSITSLKAINDTIDLFINDSDHSAEYEGKEYEAIKDKLSDKAFVLGDNSHSTDELFKFSRKYNRDFIFFSEKPDKHWYPGAGIGISFKK